MSDTQNEITGTEDQVAEINADVQEPSELDTLKRRADLLGMKYHPSISADTLKKKIAEHMAELQAAAAPAATASATPAPVTPAASSAAPVEETEGQRRKRLLMEATKLVRVNVICRNPSKREWEGEIIAGGNTLVGTHKKFVKFNTTEGWHVPQVIVNILRAREYQHFYNERTDKGQTVRKGRQEREFSVEVLEPLTQAELDQMAKVQAAARGM